MTRIGIYGYGNLGRGVEAAINQNDDMELVAVFTRRNPDELVIKNQTAKVCNVKDMADWKDKIDVMILCGGSATDLPEQTPECAKYFNVIDSFDTHARIPEHFANVDASAKASGHIGIISVGWDPGMFSLNRLYGNALLPEGNDYTFWGKGVSQGHSDAIRRIAGVKDAKQYTIPVESALEAVRNGENPALTTRQKHTRECFVVLEEGADAAKVEEEIKNVKSATSSDIDRLRDTLTFGNFSEAQVNSLEAMKAELFADESDLNSMRSEEELTKAIETVKLQKKDNEGKKDFLGYLISAVNEYAVKRAEVMLTPLKMDKAAIKLSEVVKGTGEIKDTFKFTYDGKDYRWLSNSERIKAGLEIAMLVKRLTGLTYPTFVDNAESINTNFTRPDGQMIFAFVRRCAITVHEPSPAAVKEAA